MVKLVYSDQGGREKSVEIGEHNSKVMIGRNPDCTISTNNASVSRVHAMVMWRDGKIFVSDPPNSHPTNGTKVDGMRLQQGEMLELFEGSELLCGSFQIKVVSDGDDLAHMGEQVHQIPMQMPNQIPAQMQNPMQQQMQMPPQNPNITGGYSTGGAAAAAAYNNQGNYNSPASRSGYVANVRQQAPQQQVMQPSPNMNMQRPPVRAPYNPHSASVSGINNVVPQSNIPAPDDMIKLLDEKAGLQRDLDTANANIISLNDTIKELQEKLEERNQILADSDRRNEYHETVMTGLKDMIDKLKEQLDHQKEQYQECRRDLVSSQDEAESLKLELSTLKETLESKGMATSNAETALADLKVQLTQKNRQIQDLQRELDLTQYSCKEERENCDRLKENLDTLNAALEESQRRNADMEKVVEQHEVMFSELKGNLNDRAREIRQLQDSLRAKGGVDSTALMQELATVRENLNRRTSEVELLQKQLKNAEDRAAVGAAAKAEAEKAFDRIRELESTIAKGGNELEAEVTSLQNRVDELMNENDMLRQKGGGAVSGGGDPAIMDKIRNLYSEMNDVVSQWRDDLGMLDSSISDLQRVFVAYVKINVAKLVEPDKSRLEKVLKDYDPKLIFEDIGNSLDACQNSLVAIKDKLKNLRGTLQ
ncbi:MAG: FHA domain-containing protein [Proteobacteria bacterium]|nr:FHA domain-containing protein [Pseudomonadota bacterium]